MSFRFLHASDLHLGRAFGTFPEAIRYRLREARHGAIARLAAAARSGGAATILLAGDTFDAETPAPDTLRQALRAMAAEGDITWILLPGNHDSLGATELWRRIASDAAPNLRLALEPAPVALAPGVTVLPAPCTRRRPGRDLTEWMAETGGDGLRIGLAHGAVTSFDGEEGAPGIIPPDRATSARLDWLALGDWHGTLRITDRCWYSGTPEPDSFKHDVAGGALLVALEAPGAAPKVERVETGCFRWCATGLALLPTEDAPARLAAALPPPGERRDTLLRLTLTGRLPLPARAALLRAAEEAGPDFGWFDCDAARLTVEARPDDLDLIDRGGALRTAAEALLTDAGDPALSPEDRAAAESALAHLFRLAQEVQA
ncbi:metallophosphoesterase [Cereibacter sphaeroides]|uniref:metallophosphoesterase family protein n=1 Tax=Cereibacter sphaeroides TaxID=1063 RepID=UPI001F332067|nr:metallophosphoesterase [Cereibacter sphaeroides]MCE6961854.1 metallophosphoesterase [Cereibacter sphaeroides]MCE6975775.1 metallophosphoesterase [Cereibacter sphaeroides]